MEREKFGSRRAVVFAMAGAAIGLGNIWRFPYMVGQNGGAAFIIVYLLASVFLSLPIFFSESIIGRVSRANSFSAIKKIAPGPWATLLALVMVIAPMIVLSYYSVVGGWSVDYLLKSCVSGFNGMEHGELSGMFGTFISSTWGPLACHTAFIILCALVVSGGVKSGIERFNKVSVPLLFVIILLIMIYSLCLPGAMDGVRYMVRPDFSKLTASSIASAMGQSFFSLSLGIGTVLIYSSYMRKDESIGHSCVLTLIFDVIFALIAGFAVMPAVFSAGIGPGAGPGLIFETLPYVFSKMEAGSALFGRGLAILFFLAIVIAALTSAISLFEIGVAYLMEEKKLSRRKSTMLVLGTCWFFGVFCSLSYGPLNHIHIFGKNIFDFCDYLSSNILMTFGGLLFTLIAGWVMDKSQVRAEFTAGSRTRLSSALFGTVYFFIRYIAPIAIFIIFVTGVAGV